MMTISSPAGLFVAVLMFGAICKKPVLCEETSWLQRMLRSLGLLHDPGTAHNDLESSLDLQHLTLLWGIPDTEAHIGSLFKFAIPDNAFQGSIQSYQVKAAGAHVLPQWLSFDESQRSFLGVPSSLDLGPCAIEVTAIQQDIRVTTHFVIKVTSRTDHLALWSFTSDSPQPLQIIQDSPLESIPLCNWDQNLIKATLILDVTFSDLTAKERVTILQLMSSFLTRNVHVIELIPKRHETINKLLNNEILVAGPGNVERGPTSDGTELSWVVGCQTSTKVNDLANVMEHNVQGGRFTSELKRNVIGWYISGIQPPAELRKLSRKKRAVVINLTPLATPSVSVIPSSLAIISTSTIDGTNSVYKARSQAPEASDISKTSRSIMSQTMMSPTASILSSYYVDTDWSPSSTEENMFVSLSSVVTPSLPIMTESVSPSTGASVVSYQQEDSVTISPSIHVESAVIPSSSSGIVQPSIDKNVSELHNTTNSAPVPSEIYNNSIQPTETPLEFSTLSSSVADSPSTSSVPDSSDTRFSSNLLPRLSSQKIMPSKTEVPLYESTAVSQLHSAETTSEIMSSDRFYSTSTPLLPSSIIGSQGLQPSYVLPESSILFADSSNGFVDMNIQSSLLSAGSSSFDLSFNSAPSNAIYTQLISQSMDLSSSMSVVSSFATSVVEDPFRTSVYGSELLGSISTVQLQKSSALFLDSDLLQSSNNLDKSSRQMHISPTSQLFDSSSVHDSTFTSTNPTVSIHASSVLMLDTDLVDSSTHFSISSEQELLTATPYLPDSSAVTFPTYETVTPTLNTSASSSPYSKTELYFHSNETEQASSPGSVIFPSSQESSIVYFQSTSEPQTLESAISTSASDTTPLPIDSITQSIQGSISTTVDEYNISMTSSYVFNGMSTTAEARNASEGSKSEVFLYPASTLSVYQSTSAVTSYAETTEIESYQTELPQQSTLIYSRLQSEILPLTTDLLLDSTGLVFVSSVPSAMPVSPTKPTTIAPSLSEASEPLSSELWTLQTTESDSTSLASVTEETKFSTTETPRLPIETTESPKGPVLVKPLKQLYVQVGRYFEYQVPPDTFSVGKNSAKETLQLELLSYDASPLPSDSWLLFDQHKNVIYGLPTSDQENNTRAYLLTATDSSNRRAVGQVVIRIDGYDLNEPSHRFSLTIDYDFKEFQRSIMNLINLVQLLSAFYDDSTPDNLTVMSIAQGSVVLSWMNNSLSYAICERDRITSLYKMLNNSGVTSSLRQHLYPFVPIRVTLDYLGVCAVKDSEESSDTSMLLVSILVPLFILFIGLFLLICCCHYCRSKKKHQGKVYLDGDAPVFAANRKPVVMEGELELHEMRQGLHAKPVQMARDFNDFFEPSFFPESPIKSPPPYHMQGADNFAFESDNISSNRSSPPEYKSQRSSPNISPPLYRLPPPYKFV